MGVTSTEQFLGVLEKSELLEGEQLEKARQIAQAHAHPKTAARALVQEGLLSRWQAGQLLAGRSSFLLNKYKLIDLLGRGGMGSVFLAQHCTMNRRVALKVVSREIAEDPAALERFLNEARAIASLNHPNIVQAYSVDNEGSRYYIVMEYVDGPDLRRLVRDKGPLDYRRAADYVRQVAEGLAHAHAQKIIHCDIKPSNLLINSQGVVKILDMGLARLAGHGPTPSDERPESIQGSVDYLAPEQARAEGPVDHRADIYALGCTLYFLLTGQPPFPEGTVPERLMKHQSSEPPNVAQLRPDVPAELAAVCRKMMAKKPEDRYQTAQEVVEALSRWRLPPRPSRRVRSLQAKAGSPPAGKPPKRGASPDRTGRESEPVPWDVPDSDAEERSSDGSPAERIVVPDIDSKRDETRTDSAPPDSDAQAAIAAIASAAAAAKEGSKRRTSAKPKPGEPDEKLPSAASAKRDKKHKKNEAEKKDQEQQTTRSAAIRKTAAGTGKAASNDTASGRQMLGARERKTLLISAGILGAGVLAAGVILVVMRPWATPAQQAPQTAAVTENVPPAAPSSAAPKSAPAEPLEEDISSSLDEILGLDLKPSEEAASGAAGQSSDATAAQSGSGGSAGVQDAGSPESGAPPEGPSSETTPPETTSPEPSEGQSAGSDSARPSDSSPAAGKPDEPPAEVSPPAEQPPAAGGPQQGTPSNPQPPPKPKPEPKPAPPKPKPAAAPDPLKGLLASVELPAPAAAEGATEAEVSLGQVKLGAGLGLDVQLAGGDEAIKGPAALQLQPDNTQPNCWLICLGTPALGGEQTEATQLARLWLDGQALKLAWLESATPQAGCLGNCGLQVSAGGKSRFVALSRPRPADPIVLDLDRGSARAMVAMEFPPDPGALRLQVTGVDGELPQPQYKPADTIAPKGRGGPQSGTMVVQFMPPQAPQVNLRVGFNLVGRRADIQVTAFYQIANQPPQPFQARQAAAALSTAMAMQQRLEAAQKARGLSKEAKQALQQQAEVAKSVVEHLTALNTLYQAINKKATLHYRLFVAAGDQQIELFNTRAAPSGPAEEALSHARNP